MKRFALATWAMLAGVSLAAGCASPCGGSMWPRMGWFRSRGACPCEGDLGVGLGGPGPMMSDGPLLEPPPPPVSAVPQTGLPSPMPSLGAPIGQPMVPATPPNINVAPPISAAPSSRIRR